MRPRRDEHRTSTSSERSERERDERERDERAPRGLSLRDLPQKHDPSAPRASRAAPSVAICYRDHQTDDIFILIYSAPDFLIQIFPSIHTTRLLIQTAL